MPLPCRKASLRASAVQWNLDALVVAGGEEIPCFLSVTPAYAALQAPSSAAGERLLDAASDALGRPDSPAQVVKGGPCGGEEEDHGYAFTGAMISVTWHLPKEGRDAFIGRIRDFLSPCAGLR